MSSNVGLSTPRGSGTSGFVQRNRAFQKPRDYGAPYPSDAVRQHQQRQPDKGIMEHEAKREIEIKVLELQDKLEDEAEYVDYPIMSTLTPALPQTSFFP